MQFYTVMYLLGSITLMKVGTFDLDLSPSKQKLIAAYRLSK